MIKDLIFTLFGNYEKLIDSNKVNGKGSFQRYNESLATEYDNELYSYILNANDNIIIPSSLLSKFIPFWYLSFGIDFNISPELSVKRKLLKYIRNFYIVKGTTKGYDLLFRLLGLEVTLTEHETDYRLDNDTMTFDDVNRTFDLSCNSCSEFSIDISRIDGTTTPLTDAELIGIQQIMYANTPINAIVRDIIFDGSGVSIGDFDLNDFNYDFY